MDLGGVLMSLFVVVRRSLAPVDLWVFFLASEDPPPSHVLPYLGLLSPDPTRDRVPPRSKVLGHPVVTRLL